MRHTTLRTMITRNTTIRLMGNLKPHDLVRTISILNSSNFRPTLPLRLYRPRINDIKLYPLRGRLVPMRPMRLLKVLLPRNITRSNLKQMVMLLIMRTICTTRVKSTTFNKSPHTTGGGSTITLNGSFFRYEGRGEGTSFPTSHYILSDSDVARVREGKDISFFSKVIPLLDTHFQRAKSPIRPTSRTKTSQFPHTKRQRNQRLRRKSGQRERQPRERTIHEPTKH